MSLCVIVDGKIITGDPVDLKQINRLRDRTQCSGPVNPCSSLFAENSCSSYNPLTAAAAENSEVIKAINSNMPECTTEIVAGGNQVKVLGGLLSSVTTNVAKSTSRGCQDFIANIQLNAVSSCSSSSIFNSLSVAGSTIVNLSQNLSVIVGPEASLECDNINICQIMTGCLRFVQTVSSDSKATIIASITNELKTAIDSKVKVVSEGISSPATTQVINSLTDLIDNELISDIVDETSTILTTMATATQSLELVILGRVKCSSLDITQSMSIDLVVEQQINKIFEGTINSSTANAIFNSFVIELDKEYIGIDPTIPSTGELIGKALPWLIGGAVIVGGAVAIAAIFKGGKKNKSSNNSSPSSPSYPIYQYIPDALGQPSNYGYQGQQVNYGQPSNYGYQGQPSNYGYQNQPSNYDQQGPIGQQSDLNYQDLSQNTSYM